MWWWWYIYVDSFRIIPVLVILPLPPSKNRDIILFFFVFRLIYTIIMSGYRNNNISIYLRSIDNIPSYQIDNCAKWLVHSNQIQTLYHSRIWLNNLRNHHPWQFKNIMSAYYTTKPNAYMYNNLYDNKYTSVNNYVTSDNNSYGNEPHMYYM
jgi:hypothetical protein